MKREVGTVEIVAKAKNNSLPRDHDRLPSLGMLVESLSL